MYWNILVWMRIAGRCFILNPKRWSWKFDYPVTGGTKKLQTTQGLNFVFFCTAQFVETNGLVKHNIYQELKQTIMDLDLQITRKHPVLSLPLSSYLYSESQGMPNLDHVIYRRSLDDYMTCYCCCTKWTFYVFLFLCLLCVCISGSLKLLGYC